MKRLLLWFLLTGPAALGQTLDSARVATIPTKSDFKFSLLTEVGYVLAVTSTPNMAAFYRQNQIKRDSPLDPFVHVNVGGRYQRLKLLMQTGYGVNFLAPSERSVLAVRRTYASYSGMMLGYDVLNGRNQRLYLNAGVGGLFYDYSVVNRTNQAVVFQQLPQYSQSGNIPSLKLTNTYWDLNLEFAQREKRKTSFFPVMRLGYRRGVQARQWESGALQLLDAPSDRISQVYFSGSFYISRNYASAAK
ncbi:hypothetical protein [Hymenobacter sp. UYP22]|uniref:hypothetical protein n=1 Tax=Hymenobacter sp. UYP22 TaxID=3156348 RepID=UPI0033922E84